MHEINVRVYPEFRGLSSRRGVQEAEATHKRPWSPSSSGEHGELPTVTHKRIRCSNRPFLTSADSQPGSGRNRTRIRHQYRSSRNRTLQAGVDMKFGTMNTAGLNWQRHDNHDKLGKVLQTIREK